ncbi:hypothetical protein Tco_0223349 [Tanacetum coccineum]
MSTSNTHQQSLAGAGSETRPLMLERGSYISWASRFRRYLNHKRENRKWLNKAIDEEIEELSVNICLMARIQPANFDSDEGPSYDSTFLSEVQTPSTSYVNPLFAKDAQEQKYPKPPKIINKTIGNDQIDSNIIFDEPNRDVYSGSVEYDNNVQESYALEQLARNAYKEAEKQQILAKKFNNKTQC